MEHRVVAGAGRSGPETQLQGVEGIDVGVHARQHHALIVAIGARSGGEIPVEVAAATVGRGAAHVGVAERGSAVVEVVPAGNLGTHTAGASAEAFETIAVGQAVDSCAQRADTSSDGHTVARRTLIGYRIVVQRVGRKPGESVRAVHQVGDGVGTQNDGETGAAVGIPADSHLVKTGIGSHIKRNIAPFIGQENIVNGHIGGGRRTRAFDGNEVTIASVVGKRNCIQHPVSGNSRVREGIDRCESAGIIRVGHHTHYGGRMVARRGSLGIERQSQVGYLVNIGVDARQHGILVVGIIRRG